MLVGLGNALVDYVLPLKAENPFYAQIQENKGGFFHTSQEEFLQMAALAKGAEFSCGGSAANTLKAYAHCGGEAAFVGKIGADEQGEAFKKSLQDKGVCPCLSVSDSLPSGRTIVWVDENGEKTIAAKRLATARLQNEDIDWNKIIYADMLFAEAYWLDGNTPMLRKILRLAYADGIKIALSLADKNIVAERQRGLAMILPCVSILFGNKSEFEAMGGFLKNKKMLQVMTKGADGVDVAYQEKVVHYPALKVEKIVSTTGAGDAFAGGFLFGYMKTFNIAKAVDIGQKCATQVLTSVSSCL